MIVFAILFCALASPLISQPKHVTVQHKTFKQTSLKRAKTKNTLLEKAPGLNPKVFQLALKAYQKVQKSGKTKKPILSIVDYSIASNKPRLWVIDLQKKQIKHKLHVSHGKGSGWGPVPKKFSNEKRSFASSLGVFVTDKSYQGRYGTALKLRGLEEKFNSKAYARHVVLHGSKYATKQFAEKRGYLGHSHGCLAIDPKLSPRVIELIKDGSVIFSYYPDRAWLTQSVYL